MEKSFGINLRKEYNHEEVKVPSVNGNDLQYEESSFMHLLSPPERKEVEEEEIISRPPRRMLPYLTDLPRQDPY